MSSIPGNVVLCAVPYIVQEHEGLVVFRSAHGFDANRIGNTITFEEMSGCWYVRLSDTFGEFVMLAHVEAAAKILKEHKGRDHYIEGSECRADGSERKGE